jgi:lipopolysaccharide export LptBFGC system permease protein LptF
MGDFESVTATVIFLASGVMAFATWRSGNRSRYLGGILLVLAALWLLTVGLHIGRLMGGSPISVLQLLTAALFAAAGILNFRPKRAS